MQGRGHQSTLLFSPFTHNLLSEPILCHPAQKKQLYNSGKLHLARAGLGMGILGTRPYKTAIQGTKDQYTQLYMGRFPERRHFFAENNKIGILQSL